MKKAVFVDRDGTLIAGYGNRPANTVEEVELLPSVVEGIKKLKSAGYFLVLVTNQGGVGLGFMSLKTMKKQNERLNDLLLAAGAPALDAMYWCPHRPDEGCSCRKPKPGMLRTAALDQGIDLQASVLIGDSSSDMLAGQAAKLRKKYFVLPSGEIKCAIDVSGSDLIVPNFITAASSIIQLRNFQL